MATINVEDVNRAFHQKLAKHESEERPKSPETMQFASAGQKGGTFCEVASSSCDSVLEILDRFSWFIPDKIENPVRAVIETIKEAVLPQVCGTK